MTRVVAALNHFRIAADIVITPLLLLVEKDQHGIACTLQRPNHY